MNFKYCISICSLYIIFITSSAWAQKSAWKLFFPGYSDFAYQASVDINSDLNLTILNNVVNGNHKFLSINKSGLVVYQETTNQIPVIQFKDSLNNRYVITYNLSNLIVKKTNPSGIVIYTKSNALPNPLIVGAGGINTEYFFSAVNHLMLSNGTIALSGLFRADTTGSSTYESLNVIFINPANGTILNQFTKYDLYDPVYNTLLQEDLNGDINVFYYSESLNYYRMAKVSQSGNLILERFYGDFSGSPDQYSAIKLTKSYIYLGAMINGVDFHVAKLNKTNLDTVFYVNTNLQYWSGFSSFFDASDSSFYLSHSGDGSISNFTEYGSNGNIICNDNSTIYNYGYKFALQGNNCYSARNSFSFRDTLCYLTACTPVVDNNMQNLIYGNIGMYSIPNDNYSSSDVLYIVSNLNNSVLGLIGIVDEQKVNVSGKIYYDANGNCSFDPTEAGFPNQLVKIIPTGSYMFTDFDGNFENSLDTGTYVLEPLALSNTINSCPANINLHIADTTTLYANKNFGLSDQAGNLQDLNITVNQSTAAPNLNSVVIVSVGNLLPLAASGNVVLSFDQSIFSYISASPVPDSIIGNQCYWSFTNLGFYNSLTFRLVLKVDTLTPNGTGFTTFANVINSIPEGNITNNQDQFSDISRGSFDPNDKNVSPKGYGPIGLISPADSILTYKIRFQNTGTYTAYKVVVIDTLDSDLNIESFLLLSSSHPCQLSIIGSNIIVCTFEDIMLPDSTTNELLSHGFVNFRINLKSGLTVGSQILNQAYIYFDYNEPVATNQTINTIGTVSLSELESSDYFTIYPNPASEEISIQLKNDTYVNQLILIDLHGRSVMDEKINRILNVKTFSIRDLKSGFYILTLKTQNSVVSKPFIKQ